MSSVEVMAVRVPYARYTVASQETEPALGWAYAKFLGQLAAKPTQSGAELAKAIVNSYIVNDLRITDDDARSIFLEELGEIYAHGQSGGPRDEHRCDLDGA